MAEVAEQEAKQEATPALKLEQAQEAQSTASTAQANALRQAANAKAALLKGRTARDLTDEQFLALGTANTEATVALEGANGKLATAEKATKRAAFLVNNAALIAKQAPVNALNGKLSVAIHKAVEPFVKEAQSLGIEGWAIGKAIIGDEGLMAVDSIRAYGPGVVKAPSSGGGNGGSNGGQNIYTGPDGTFNTHDLLVHFNASLDAVGKTHRADAIAKAKGYTKSKKSDD